MCRALGATISLAPGFCAVDAEPIVKTSDTVNVGCKRLILRQWILSGNNRDRKFVIEERVVQRLRTPDREPGQHGEPLNIEHGETGAMSPRRKSHSANMSGQAAGNLQRPQLGGCPLRTCDPMASKIVVFRRSAMLDQHDDSVVMLQDLGTLEPGILGEPANTDLCGIEKISSTLDID